MSVFQRVQIIAKPIVAAVAIAVGMVTHAPAQAQRGPAARPAARSAPPPAAASPKVAFNRANFGPQSGVNPGLLRRAYRAYDATQSSGGARGAGLRAGAYRNDARKGETPLPRATPSGTPITYQRVDLRPGGHARSLSNARAVVGSDKSVWVSRHYGQDGGKVKRVQ